MFFGSKFDDEEINAGLTTNNKMLGELVGDVTTQDIRFMLDKLREEVSVANDYSTLSKLIKKYQEIAEGLLEEVESILTTEEGNIAVKHKTKEKMNSITDTQTKNVSQGINLLLCYYPEAKLVLDYDKEIVMILPVEERVTENVKDTLTLLGWENLDYYPYMWQYKVEGDVAEYYG